MESLVKHVVQQSLMEWDTTNTLSQSTSLSGSLADEAQKDPGPSLPCDASPGSLVSQLGGDEFV